MHFAGLSCDEYEADLGNERAVNQALELVITGAVPNSSSPHTCRAASSSNSRRELFTSDEIGISMRLTVRDAAFGGTTSKTNITNKAQDSFTESAASGDLIRAIVENAPAGSFLNFASVYPHAPPTSLPTASPTGDRLDTSDSFGIPRGWESFANLFLAFFSIFTFGFATFVFASKEDASPISKDDTFELKCIPEWLRNGGCCSCSCSCVLNKIVAIADVAFKAVKKNYPEILPVTFGTMDLISDLLFAVQCIYWSKEPNLANDDEDYIAPAMSIVGYVSLSWVLVCVCMNGIFIFRLRDKWDQEKMNSEGMYKYGAVLFLTLFGLDAMTMLPWGSEKRLHDSFPQGDGVKYSLYSKLVEDIPQFIFQGAAMVILSSNPITAAHAFSSVSATCLIISIISFAHASLTKLLMLQDEEKRPQRVSPAPTQRAQEWGGILPGRDVQLLNNGA